MVEPATKSWGQRYRGLAVAVGLAVICAVIWGIAHHIAERKRRDEDTRQELYQALVKSLLRLNTGERTVRGNCSASIDKTKLNDVSRASDNNDWEGMAALGAGPVFTIKAGTKVYMETIETLNGQTCIGACDHGYALVHVESGKYIGTDVWIPSVEVEYTKEEVADGTVERSQRPSKP
jgi:hypothetical protein